MTHDIPAELVAQAQDWRHDLHRHPELAYQEHRTAAFVAAQLESFGYQLRQGVGVTGVIGTKRWGDGGASIALRADMDALPIHEETGLPYASQTAGIMHACGHDGHTAMLLAAAKLAAARRDLNGTLHVIFQPAEEVEGGAKRMIEDGLFDHIAPDRIYGMHNWPGSPIGSVAAPDGPMMAAFGVFDIKITGKGAHGAMPHQGADPILAASQIVSALQSIVARNVSPLDPAVISVTKIHGGDAYNVIPEAVTLAGTTRWFSPGTAALIEHRLPQIAQHIASGLQCSAEVTQERRYPATINDPKAAAFVRDVAAGHGFDVIQSEPSMGAEDFAFMLEKVEGAYIWLGSAREGMNPALHSPQFDFNDAAMKDGITLWTRLIEKALERGNPQSASA